MKLKLIVSCYGLMLKMFCLILQVNMRSGHPSNTILKFIRKKIIDRSFLKFVFTTFLKSRTIILSLLDSNNFNIPEVYYFSTLLSTCRFQGTGSIIKFLFTKKRGSILIDYSWNLLMNHRKINLTVVTIFSLLYSAILLLCHHHHVFVVQLPPYLRQFFHL